jgi:peptide-methionine (S)-S-oxide reductase
MNNVKPTEMQQFQLHRATKHYHQQYLHKNPGGYCGLSGCNIDYPGIQK